MQTNLSLPWEFDSELIEEIRTLRHLRIEHYEDIRNNLQNTQKALSESGLEISETELLKEIDEKITLLKERLKNEGTIFFDEIELYMSLL